MNKLVSVIIPTYKRSDTLPRSIDSVLNQSYKNIEIIIVDDNDSDSEYRKQTEIVMQAYINFPNVSYYKHETNKNGSAARNTGFRNSKGEYIMFLDDDDEFTKDKVAAQVNKLNNLDDSWGACYTNYVRMKNSEIIMYGAEKREGKLLTEELMRNLFVHAGSNLMIRRGIVEELNGFDESFKRNQDVEFLSRILKNYKLAYVDVVGLIVHVHEKDTSIANFVDVTTKYVEKFSGMISELPDFDKKRIDIMITLQLIRYYLISKRDFRESYQLIKTKDIPIFTIVRYFIHLLKRKITKKSYGFNI